jgi:UDP-glucose 4-epimerase
MFLVGLFNTMNAILVTGATGFLGSSLVKRLLLDRFKVIALYRGRHGFLSGVNDSNLVFINSFDVSKLSTLNIKTIYHLASSIPSNDHSSYGYHYDSNVELTKKVINIAKKINIRQFVFASTGSVFFKSDNNIFSENTCVNPQTNYGLTKYIAEKNIQMELRSSGVQISIIRFPSIFGLNNSCGIIKAFYKLAARNDDIYVYDNGEKFRSLIYIDDAIDILFRVYANINSLNKFEIFMAGSNNYLKVGYIAETLVDQLNSKSKVYKINEHLDSSFDGIVDISKAKKKLDFNPSSIESGVKKYISAMKKA